MLYSGQAIDVEIVAAGKEGNFSNRAGALSETSRSGLSCSATEKQSFRCSGTGRCSEPSYIGEPQPQKWIWGFELLPA